MRKWHTYRTNLTQKQAKRIVDRLVKNGKSWGEEVTTTNDKNVFTVHTRK